MTKGRVLVIGSNATRIELAGGGTAAIGQYLNETVVPAMALLEAGFEIVLATPLGTKPPIDAVSDSAEHFADDEAAYAHGKRFYAEHPAMNHVTTLGAVIEGGLDGFLGVFVPGGHAPAVDLMQDPGTGTILRHMHQAGKPTALLCHGPVATIAALPEARRFRAALMTGDTQAAAGLAGGWAYHGYKMTVFSTSEEQAAEAKFLHGKLVFDMPTALHAAGAIVSANPTDFEPFLVTDRELVTAQNPKSDHLVARALIEALDRSLTTR